MDAIARAKEFLTEVKVEVKKVTWPTRREATGGTAVVLIVVCLLSLYLGVLDSIISKAVQALLKI
jgi:preprotein translocase subunit SecE